MAAILTELHRGLAEWAAAVSLATNDILHTPRLLPATKPGFLMNLVTNPLIFLVNQTVPECCFGGPS